MRNLPQTDAEILECMSDLGNRKDGADIRQLTDELDVGLWVEPKERWCDVDADGTVFVYFACVNYGWFHKEAMYQLSQRKAVIALQGTTSGRLPVKPCGASEHGIGWDRCGVMAQVCGQTDDCLCVWSHSENGVTRKALNSVKMITRKS